MPYVALYRQWRPQTFAEVVCQSHVTGTLQNALRAGKIGHAYLFAGPRGTGKTSVAKILARAVNCLEGPGVEPCNRCAACLSVLDGSATDVIEIDAASNRGIDEIRDLRNKVKFCPANLKYKVYIIDEVHMLTTEAFNALLKTLEEPPAHAIFVLATTEPHKIPATVMSRCQRFSFHRIPVKEVLARMEAMTGSIGLPVTRDALRVIARAADGSLRDALSLLDQCASFSEGEVNASHVRAILGSAGPEGVREIATAVADGDAGAVLQGLDRLAAEGKDLRQFGRDLTAFYRDLLVTKVCKDPGDLVDQDPESFAMVKDLASQYSEDSLLEAIRALGEVDTQVRYSQQPRICLEICLLRLIGNARRMGRPANRGEPDGKPEVPDSVRKPDRPGVDTRREGAAGAEPPAGLDESRIAEMWQSLMARLKKERKATIAAFLEPAKPLGLRNGRLTIGFGPDARFHMSQIEAPHNTKAVEAALKAVTGQSVLVTCVYRENEDDASESQPAGNPGGALGGTARQAASLDADDESVRPGHTGASGDSDEVENDGDVDPVQKTLDLFDGTIV